MGYTQTGAEMYTPGPWRVAQLGTPMPAPDGLPAEKRAEWDALQEQLNRPRRDNDGAISIVDAEGAGVARAVLTVKAKRGQAYETDDPRALANARLIAAAPDLLAAARDLFAGGGPLADPSLFAALALAVAKAEGVA